jgi:hypothetical protein|uniref:Uncharacterized protein n=1 Tax=Oryza rufipogon TaxID=4529 RepID=A0A0E0Q4M9_ORYRU
MKSSLLRPNVRSGVPRPTAVIDIPMPRIMVMIRPAKPLAMADSSLPRPPTPDPPLLRAQVDGGVAMVDDDDSVARPWWRQLSTRSEKQRWRRKVM